VNDLDHVTPKLLGDKCV